MLFGKIPQIVCPPSLTTHPTAFELIHTDLWGPAPSPSHGGYFYYVAFVDACTKYTWIYFLKNKFDAISAFKQFHSLVQTRFSKEIKDVQSDWGGEFRTFTRFLTDLGIQYRLTCPHTSHQNGTVERKHRKIVEI